MRAITWAIRVTFADGSGAFLRNGGVFGRGPIATFRTKLNADSVAADLREELNTGDTVTVIERSHGRITDENAHRAPR